MKIVWTVAGLAVFVLAYGWLLLTGNTVVRQSADEGATGLSLWALLVPQLAAIALAVLVRPRAQVPLPLADLPRRRLARETWVLLGAALAFPAAVLFTGRGDFYPVAKVVFLLVVPLVAFRLIRGGEPAARSIPRPVTWLAPLPAVAVWFVLTQIWPFATPLTQELPDPVTLAVQSLVVALTAGVLEEVFYRAWLQTRLEVLIGRWPAILGSALLFALMHVGHIQPGAIGLGLASIVAAQGLWGVMQGYLWARYRNIWVIVFIHVVINLIYVDLLLSR